MHPLLNNKYVRFIGLAILSVVTIFVILLTLASLNSNSTGLSSGSGMFQSPAITMDSDAMMRNGYADKINNYESLPYLPPTPVNDDYTANLESYETTNYSVNVNTKQFDEVCNSLLTLKDDPGIHFKTINSSLNNCRAVFYVAEEKANTVLSTLTSFKGVEVDRNTESVTKHRAVLQNQTNILQQQLASVENSLNAAETQFNEIAEFARGANDAATLSLTIREKISLVENLTQQKISLVSQLNQLHQQATDLEERLNVVAFSVNVNRSYPIYINKQNQKWENAWEDLKDEFTNTGINLTVIFGVFLLRALQAIIYGVVIIFVIRTFWKFAKMLWGKW